MGWLGTLSANTTLALRTGRAGAAAATADLELATVFDVFEVADPEALGAVADELETVTVFPEFALATEFLLLELSALFDSEDFVLLERTVTVFADDLVPSSALVVESVELFALGLLGECAAPDPASGCFESNAVGEDATAFDSTGVEIVDVLEPFPRIATRSICNRLCIQSRGIVRGILGTCRCNYRLPLWLSWLRFTLARIILLRRGLRNRFGLYVAFSAAGSSNLDVSFFASDNLYRLAAL
jgi:hypothetical protein